MYTNQTTLCGQRVQSRLLDMRGASSLVILPLQARRLLHSQLHGDAVDPCCAHIIWRHGQLLASLYTLSVVPFFNMI